jgi:hypothetical protein
MAYEAKLFVPTGHPASKHTMRQIRSRLCDEFGGCTVISDASGDWADPQTNQIVEDDVSLVLVTTDQYPNDVLSEIAELIKSELNEDSVHYTITQVESVFA